MGEIDIMWQKKRGISNMSKRQKVEHVSDSQNAIRSYIEYVESKGGLPEHHKARVLISRRNYNYNKILEIGVKIETNNSMVIICGDDEFCREFYPEYNNEYQIFKYFSSGGLIISEAEDNWGNSIEIDISYYKSER